MNRDCKQHNPHGAAFQGSPTPPICVADLFSLPTQAAWFAALSELFSNENIKVTGRRCASVGTSHCQWQPEAF
jgi:hypothetical protein